MHVARHSILRGHLLFIHKKTTFPHFKLFSTYVYQIFLGTGEELWECSWRPGNGPGKFPILDKPIQGGVKPKQAQASKVAYVPPNQRGKAKINNKGDCPL